MDENLSVTIQTKAIEQNFAVVVLKTLHKVVLTFKSVDEFLKSDHLSEPFLWGYCKRRFCLSSLCGSRPTE